MKGLSGSAGVVAAIALGLFPGANGSSLEQGPSDHRPNGGVDAELPSTNASDDSLSRRLQRRGRPRPVNDDALDPNGTVSASARVTCQRVRRAGRCRGR